MLKIVKLGGSALTYKDKPLVARIDVIERIGEELKPAYPDLIVVHGTGSFGHPLVLKYGIHKGVNKEFSKIMGVGETKFWVTQLTQMVFRSLLDAGIPSFIFFPSSLGIMDGGKFIRFDFEPIKGFLEMGFVPLIPADGPFDKKLGAAIASGDYLAYILAKYFKPSEVIFAIDEDGLFVGGELVEELTHKQLHEIYDEIEKGEDATGGMRGKLDYVFKILNLGIPVKIVNLTKPNWLKKLLLGEKVPHTIIKP